MATTKSRTSSTKRAASKATRTAAKGVATGAAKSAAKSAAKGATKGASKAVAAGGERVGRGTRWTEAQVRLLLDTVGSSATAKEAFEKVATELDKNAGTVAQKYYNLQKAAGSGSGKRGRKPAGRKPQTAASKGSAASSARTTGSSRATGGLPSAAQLRGVTVDELVGLASRVREEIDRRRDELEEAARRLVG